MATHVCCFAVVSRTQGRMATLQPPTADEGWRVVQVVVADRRIAGGVDGDDFVGAVELVVVWEKA